MDTEPIDPKYLEAAKGVLEGVDELIAMVKRIGEERDALLAACRAVEEWWLREGMRDNPGIGAPACIFMVRDAIAKAEERQP